MRQPLTRIMLVTRPVPSYLASRFFWIVCDDQRARNKSVVLHDLRGLVYGIVADRGIGLELCKQLHAAGKNVVATCRKATPELNSLGLHRVIENVDVG